MFNNLVIYYMMAFVFCWLSFLGVDPIKSSLILIVSLVFSVSFFNFMGVMFFSYFLSLVFLSGVFVILVYVSSLSKIGARKVGVNVFFFYVDYSFFLFLCFCFLFYGFNYFFIVVCVFIYFFFIFFLLYLFLIYMSFFFNFQGALRNF